MQHTVKRLSIAAGVLLFGAVCFVSVFGLGIVVDSQNCRRQFEGMEAEKMILPESQFLDHQ